MTHLVWLKMSIDKRANVSCDIRYHPQGISVVCIMPNVCGSVVQKGWQTPFEECLPSFFFWKSLFEKWYSVNSIRFVVMLAAVGPREADKCTDIVSYILFFWENTHAIDTGIESKSQSQTQTQASSVEISTCEWCFFVRARARELARTTRESQEKRADDQGSFCEQLAPCHSDARLAAIPKTPPIPSLASAVKKKCMKKKKSISMSYWFLARQMTSFFF